MDIDLKKFGLLLKQALNNNHETQSQLAEAINVSQSTISKVINGIYPLTPELATSIANHFPDNIAMSAMLSKYMPSRPQDPIEQEICSYIPHLSPEDKATILRFVEFLINSYQSEEYVD